MRVKIKNFELAGSIFHYCPGTVPVPGTAVLYRYGTGTRYVPGYVRTVKAVEHNKKAAHDSVGYHQ